MADRAESNKVPTRNAPNSDQEPQRSRGSDDRPTPPPRDEMNRKTAPDRDSVAPSSPAPVANRITATESPTKKSCNGLLQQNRHKADIPARPLFVRFSNRPSGSSTFRLTTTPVSMSLTGSRFSSDSAPRPFHHGDSKTRWNNLSGGLAVNMTAGPSGQTISPHPSSREGHHSTARWSSISSYRI